MKPSQRLMLCSAVYAAVLTTVVIAAYCTIDYSGDYVSGLLIASMLLVAIFASLSPFRAVYRTTFSTIAVAYIIALLALANRIEDEPADRTPNEILNMVAVFSLVIGLMLPVRGYLGTVRQPGTSTPHSKPTVFLILAIVSFFAVVASVFSFTDSADVIPLALIAAFGWTACIGPVFAMLTESKKTAIVGMILMLVSIAVALYLILAVALSRVFLEVASGILPSVIIPLCAAYLLRRNGYRLHS